MNNQHRPWLPTRRVSLSPRPICRHCHHFMGIVQNAKINLIGRQGNYVVIVEFYQCRHLGCPGRKDPIIRAPNPYAGEYMHYDYEVQAEVCLIRWTEHATYKEIVSRIKDRIGIDLDKTAVELFLKTYEIGCAREYREQYLQKMQEKQGIMLCIDVMEPLQGKDGFLVAYDGWSKLTLGSYRMPNDKQATYEVFLTQIKERVANEIGLPIIGVISDALPAQRLAIENVFKGVPHCLCHYHFFNLVLNDAKKLDSKIVTQLREALRRLYDLKEYHFRVQKHTLSASQYAQLAPFLEILLELSNWRRKPNDPCFIGLELYNRVGDILSRLKRLRDGISNGNVIFHVRDHKVLNRIIGLMDNIATDLQPAVLDLTNIRGHIETIVAIFDEWEASAEQGLQRIRIFCENLKPTLALCPKDTHELIFIEALLKFIDTKGELLFNYREIAGAPSTNNDLELRFKQMKHLLRRTIGHAAAKYYLMMHGERIFYVNPQEPVEQIVNILQKMDQSIARNQIRNERQSQDRLGLIIHDDVRWGIALHSLDQYLSQLGCID